MIAKLLLTLAVIIIAFLVIRKRREPGARATVSPASSPASETSSDSPKPRRSVSDFRIAAYLFLILMLGTAGTLYYSRWQDNHVVVEVTLHRGGDSEPDVFYVYQYQLTERSFVTTDGRRITLASSDRMEVKGLRQPR